MVFNRRARGVKRNASIPTKPGRDPVAVEDLLTTVYHQMGINADKELMAPGDRPMEIIDGGRVVKEILG